MVFFQYLFGIIIFFLITLVFVKILKFYFDWDINRKIKLRHKEIINEYKNYNGPRVTSGDIAIIKLLSGGGYGEKYPISDDEIKNSLQKQVNIQYEKDLKLLKKEIIPCQDQKK